MMLSPEFSPREILEKWFVERFNRPVPADVYWDKLVDAFSRGNLVRLSYPDTRKNRRRRKPS